jgi:hypothetical protein
MITVGLATRDFTPRRPAMLHGQMHVRIAHEARDSLLLTAIALEGGPTPDQRLLLISCDLLMIPASLWEGVRAKLRTALPEVPSDNILMAGTHTHESLVIDPQFYPHPGGDVMTAQEGLEWTIEHATAVAVEAWQRRGPHRFHFAFGHAVVGHNRRAVYADGRSVMYGKTDRPDFRAIEGSEDHSLDMLFFWKPDGVLEAIALAIPCPAQVDEGITQFSADFWHEIRVDLRRRFGRHLTVIPLCGTAGDQSPHFLIYGREEAEMRRRRGLTEREEIAARVGDAVARALLCTHPSTDSIVFSHRVRRFLLPPRTITRPERDWAEQERTAALKRGMAADLWWPVRLQNVLEAFDQGRALPPEPAEIHAIRLGDLAVITNPFELFLDYGFQIKARSPATQTVVTQLVGQGFYLPTERAVAGGHYSAHPVVAPVGPEGGQRLVEESLHLLASLFAPPTA